VRWLALISYKFSDGPVIGTFRFVREKAGGKLLHTRVVLNALAAKSLSAAGFIGAVAETHIFLLVGAVHCSHPFSGSNFSDGRNITKRFVSVKLLFAASYSLRCCQERHVFSGCFAW